MTISFFDFAEVLSVMRAPLHPCFMLTGNLHAHAAVNTERFAGDIGRAA